MKPLNAALAKQYPDTQNRIRALLAWFGSGAGPWSGYPGYEEIAEKLLRQYPTVELIGVVENRKLSKQELEGTARILGSWTSVPDHTAIPEQLRRTLLDYCLKSSDEDKRERARKAFSRVLAPISGLYRPRPKDMATRPNSWQAAAYPIYDGRATAIQT